MYMEYYGLSADPFRLAADYRNLYSHPSYVKARSYLQYGMQSDNGIVLVTGKAGTGKSSLLRSEMLEAIENNHQAVLLDCIDFSGKQMLASYARLLGTNPTGQSITELLHSITEILLKHREQGKQTILMLDEAHQLTSDALTKLTMLANREVAGQSLVQIALVGQPSVWEKISLPKHEQLHQRLMATCEIEQLNSAETKEYILQNLQAADWNNNPRIASNVYTAVHRSSLGIRRWINLICGRMMLHAMAHDRQELELPDLCEVISDLINEGLLPQEIRETNLIAA